VSGTYDVQIPVVGDPPEPPDPPVDPPKPPVAPEPPEPPVALPPDPPEPPEPPEAPEPPLPPVPTGVATPIRSSLDRVRLQSGTGTGASPGQGVLSIAAPQVRGSGALEEFSQLSHLSSK
jgi:hypothetical protein